jgi:hypothetical protein
LRIKHVRAETLVGTSSRLDILRHGLDEELILLRSPKKS